MTHIPIAPKVHDLRSQNNGFNDYTADSDRRRANTALRIRIRHGLSIPEAGIPLRTRNKWARSQTLQPHQSFRHTRLRAPGSRSVLPIHCSDYRAGDTRDRDFSRGDKIRTCDLLVPNQALYQAEPHPEFEAINLAQLCRYHKADRLRRARATAVFTRKSLLPHTNAIVDFANRTA